MNKIKILGLFLIISPFLIFAHNPLSSKFHLTISDKVSLLTVNLSQTGVEQVLLKNHSAEELNSMNSKEFKELIIAYVKNNFFLAIDGEAVELKKGGIKLGAHQTDLKFVLKPFSKSSKKAVINIPAFKENGEHQTIFLLNFFDEKGRVILSSRNNYKSKMYLSQEENSYAWLWIGVIVSFVFVIFFFVRKKLFSE